MAGVHLACCVSCFACSPGACATAAPSLSHPLLGCSPLPFQAHVQTLYLEENGSGNGGAATAEQLLERVVLEGEGGLKAVLGGADPATAAVRWSASRQGFADRMGCSGSWWADDHGR